MTTLNAATIASMTRTAIWAYISDNALPVARKRSTEDARNALIAYIESLAPATETVQDVTETVTEYAAEPITATPAPVQDEEPVIEQVQVEEPVTEQPVTTKHSAAIVVVMVLVAIQVILTKLVIPATVTAVTLVSLGYVKAYEAYKRYAAAHPHTDSLTINYFDDLEVG